MKNDKFKGCLPASYSRCCGRYTLCGTEDQGVFCPLAFNCARYQAFLHLDKKCGIKNYREIDLYMAEKDCAYCISLKLFDTIKKNREESRENGGEKSKFFDGKGWIKERDLKNTTKYDSKSRHYGVGGIEALEVIKAKLTPEQYQGFCLGNATKYVCRANHKDDLKRDVEKAIFYLNEVLKSDC